MSLLKGPVSTCLQSRAAAAAVALGEQRGLFAQRQRLCWVCSSGKHAVKHLLTAY